MSLLITHSLQHFHAFPFSLMRVTYSTLIPQIKVLCIVESCGLHSKYIFDSQFHGYDLQTAIAQQTRL
jgi:NMD protein affecting ribosome stability and mRNA decay